MLASSMPNLVTKFLLVLHIEDYISSGTSVKEIYFRIQTTKSGFSHLRATKCLATKLGFLADKRNQVLQVSALVMVSYCHNM